jgi:hypothetical protein
MLKLGEVNPLAVFGLRRVEHFPPHFTPVRFDAFVADKQLTDWIWEHLSGRFYFDDEYATEKQTISAQKIAAFEIPGEASYFSLILDTINKREIW